MSRTYDDPPRYGDEELEIYNRVHKELLIEDAKWNLDNAMLVIDEAIEDAGLTHEQIRQITDYEELAQEYIDRADPNFSSDYLWMLITEEYLNDILEWGLPKAEDDDG